MLIPMLFLHYDVFRSTTLVIQYQLKSFRIVEIGKV
jgi:hypothetical protein